MRRRFGAAHVAALSLAALFSLWTYLTFRTTVFARIDAMSDTPGVDAASPVGQVLAAIAVVTTPVVMYVLLAGFALWAARRRLTNLAWAAGLVIPLAWGSNHIVKLWARRPRPGTAANLITAEGWSYPSAHMTAVTVVAVMFVAAMVLTRRRRPNLILAAGALFTLWWVVLVNRWLLRAHWFSDLLAGGFLGGLVASGSLALAGVHVLRLTGPVRAASGRTPRAAVVYNPTKVPDPALFRRQIEGECDQRGWEPPLWLETDAADAGAGVARVARKRRVDLVLIAGGDGTVRAVCGQLSQSGIPVGILPTGTGNLMARNLGVPLDLADALDVAFEGAPHAIDLVQVRADGGDVDHSLVMAGMGVDGLIMAATNPELKKVVGSAAYVMAALSALNRPPFDAAVTLDGGPAFRRRPGVALVANVGAIQGQILIAPDAAPDDGVVDVVIASPERWADWGAITTRILVRAPDAPGVERAHVRSAVFEADEPVPYQIDGDAMGTCRRLEAQVLPGALLVMTP